MMNLGINILQNDVGYTVQLNGEIDVDAWTDNGASDVVFNFYDENRVPVSYKNVGQGLPSVKNTGLQLTMNWTKSGMVVNTYTPNGTSIDKDTDTVVYVEVLDNYENNAYDIQQELLRSGFDKICVEIASVRDFNKMDKLFKKHNPTVIFHAAAHKHVPLMEDNPEEAIKNNCIGTNNLAKLCNKYSVSDMIFISTDKATTPDNIMAASKRISEILLKYYNQNSTCNFKSIRFGNVLGSAGSVIPLFKKQIARGGPITITDKRIVRYFMTIPEASQLVLKSGAMAENGELFVLDMGKPVKIIELAENMIRLSGMEPYNDIEIIETGLRPGEKLYEETLVNADLEKTESSAIFIEREKPHSMAEINAKLSVLRTAIETGGRQGVRIPEKIWRTERKIRLSSEKLHCYG